MFFLDEFRRLKRMDSIMRLVDTGRGAGVRLWFFAQYLGQIRQAYDKQADGLIGACKVRSFLSPDAEAAEFLKPYLGTTHNLFTGEKKPLPSPMSWWGRPSRTPSCPSPTAPIGSASASPGKPWLIAFCRPRLYLR